MNNQFDLIIATIKEIDSLIKNNKLYFIKEYEQAYFDHQEPMFYFVRFEEFVSQFFKKYPSFQITDAYSSCKFSITNQTKPDILCLNNYGQEDIISETSHYMNNGSCFSLCLITSDGDFFYTEFKPYTNPKIFHKKSPLPKIFDEINILDCFGDKRAYYFNNFNNDTLELRIQPTHFNELKKFFKHNKDSFLKFNNADEKINLKLTNITDDIYLDNYYDILKNIFQQLETATKFLDIVDGLSWMKENENFIINNQNEIVNLFKYKKINLNKIDKIISELHPSYQPKNNYSSILNSLFLNNHIKKSQKNINFKI